MVLLCLCLCLLSISPRAELLARPTISISQDTAIEQRGQVTLFCDTKNANVTIHWFANNVPLVFHERMLLSTDGKKLTILTVRREDSGTYKCKAEGFRQVQSSDPTFLTVNCESLSVLPSSSLIPLSG